MAPEQALGRKRRPPRRHLRVGVMLWETATGRRMWKDRDDMAILQSLVGGEIPFSPRAVEPSVPEALDAICKKALAFKVGDRYATAEQFGLELDEFLSSTDQISEARRRLGAAVADLFKDNRENIKGILEKQLAQQHSTEFQPATISQGEGTPQPTLAFSIQGEAPSKGTDLRPTEVYRGRGKRTRWMMGGVALAIVMSAAVAIVARRAIKHSASLPSPVGVTAPESQVQVSIEAYPASAIIRIDDHQVANPYRATEPRDTNPHLVEISAAGFATQTDRITFATDTVRRFQLSQSETAGVPAPVVASFQTPPPRRGPPTSHVSTAAHAQTAAAAISPAPPASAAPAAPESPQPEHSPQNEDGPRHPRSIDRTDPFANPTP